jgi:hypothetical protein
MKLLHGTMAMEGSLAPFPSFMFCMKVYRQELLRIFDVLHICYQKLFTLLDLCVSSLRRGHANLLCIVPIQISLSLSLSLCLSLSLSLSLSPSLSRSIYLSHAHVRAHVRMHMHTPIPNETNKHSLNKWSGAVSVPQRTLLFILIQCPAIASGARFCLGGDRF